MDMAVASTLCQLPRASAQALYVTRLSAGKYMIDGRPVSVDWLKRGPVASLVAFEDDVPGTQVTPLLQYLQQASAVASSVGGAHIRGSRIRDNTSTGVQLKDADDPMVCRVGLMMQACLEAGDTIVAV